MPRPIWKGYISFGLINIPVILYSAEKKFDIQFKLVDSRDQAKIRYVRVNEQTGEEVPWKDIAKAYQYEDDSYVVLSEEELKSMVSKNSKTVNIEGFINQGSLDCMDFEKPYYLVPDKKNDKGYVILREVLKNTNKVAIAKVMIHTREYLCVLMPYENAIMLNILRYHQEIMKPSELDLPGGSLSSYKINAREMNMAKQLVASMTMKWNPDEFHDEYRQQLHEWVKEKIRHEKPKKGKKAKISASTKSTNVINFVDLLKKSMHTKGKKSSPVKRTKTNHRKRKVS